MAKYRLVSFKSCPWVQRAAIVLAEKGVAFERRDVDLANKPQWFLALSPLGKTPVLVADTTSATTAIATTVSESLAWKRPTPNCSKGTP